MPSLHGRFFAARGVLAGLLFGALAACGGDTAPGPGGPSDAGVSRPDAGVDAGLPPPEIVPIPSEQVTLSGHAYRAYQRPGDTFRIVCEEPCPIEERYLFARYAGFLAVKDDLLSLTGVDVPSRLTPVDIHLTGDSLCGPRVGTVAGSSFMNVTDLAPGPGSNVCLWELEASRAPLPEVARPLTVENALARENQVLLAHEYSHVVLFLRHELSYEWVVRAISYRVGGQADSFCSPMNRQFAPTAWELCQRNGMDYAQLAESLRRLDALWVAGEGLEDLYRDVPRATSAYQYRRILDGLVGSDTLAACLAGGELWANQCGDAARFTPAGGTVTMYGGLVHWDLPAGALSADVQVEPGTWRKGMVVPEPWYPFMFAHGYSFEPASVTFNQPVRLTVRYDPALMPDASAESSLTLYLRPDAQPAQAVPGAVVDPVAHTVSALVTKLGRYVIAPR
ncbi:hypothetical protein [Corallococcus sicarius]|uniref:Peptidase MA-like domain-containing protein n=1 Tax=Corallococcus sicarius TaxID=2316726 RepID=A0A3A8P1B9_9BACT|nr:hypothetical protein [Corallococcus sicarius]RKH45544.1 hypothetical protein D7X12_07785 [Corallococcus sicarius]